MPDDLRRQTEDVVRYYGELNRRVANCGMEGIPRLLETWSRVEHAVSEVATQEIAWIATELRHLVERLTSMDTQLRRLRELKQQLERPAESADADRSGV